MKNVVKYLNNVDFDSSYDFLLYIINELHIAVYYNSI